jgi:hypothetical protein
MSHVDNDGSQAPRGDLAPDTPDQPADTLMWEARTQPETRNRLLEWAECTLVPFLTRIPGYLEADLYLGGPDRIVLIARFESKPPHLPGPPSELIARPVHQWRFTHHVRDRASGRPLSPSST